MELLTVGQVAGLLSVSKSLVYQLKDEGKLRYFRIAKGAIRFDRADVEEYVASCAECREQPRRAERPRQAVRTFKYLDGDRLLAAWQRQGASTGRTDERNAPTSG